MLVVQGVDDNLVIVVMRIRGEIVYLRPVRAGVSGLEHATEWRGGDVCHRAIHGDHCVDGIRMLSRDCNA